LSPKIAFWWQFAFLGRAVRRAERGWQMCTFADIWMSIYEELDSKRTESGWFLSRFVL